jgi:non-specific serine/threonine protein kinase
VGKTRLALRAAADLQRTLRDGVWFVDLAGLEDPHLVAKAVISGLGVADQSGQWPTSLLVAHLASREALLILDNCEHLLDAVAVLADVVLKEAAGVRLLATSRQPLGISGERVVQVPPLTLQEESSADSRPGAAIPRRSPCLRPGRRTPASNSRIRTPPANCWSTSVVASTACR